MLQLSRPKLGAAELRLPDQPFLVPIRHVSSTSVCRALQRDKGQRAGCTAPPPAPAPCPAHIHTHVACAPSRGPTTLPTPVHPPLPPLLAPPHALHWAPRLPRPLSCIALHCSEPDPDPHGAKLAATTDPLGEASKLVAQLVQHAAGRGRLATHVMAAELALRKGRLLVALGAVQSAARLAPGGTGHPQVHSLLVALLHKGEWVGAVRGGLCERGCAGAGGVRYGVGGQDGCLPALHWCRQWRTASMPIHSAWRLPARAAPDHARHPAPTHPPPPVPQPARRPRRSPWCRRCCSKGCRRSWRTPAGQGQRQEKATGPAAPAAARRRWRSTAPRGSSAAGRPRWGTAWRPPRRRCCCGQRPRLRP